MKKPLFDLAHVCFSYDGVIALNDISFSVEKGETVLLCGDNGSGKSTLLKLLNGLIFAEEGSFVFDGEEITAKKMKEALFSKRYHRRVGFVFQDSESQLFNGSVREEIAFGPEQMGLSKEEVNRRVEDCLKLFHLEKQADRAPYHLSGGERKKTAIACILSMNPDVLILDEPLAGLDRKTGETVISLLMQLKKAGKTLIIATHDDRIIEKLGGRIITFSEEHRVLSDIG